MNNVIIREETINRRSMPRLNLTDCWILMVSENFSELVRIDNIARLGFLARSRFLYRTCDEVILKLPVISVSPAKIIWQNKDEFGARFDEALDPNLFDEMLNVLNGYNGSKSQKSRLINHGR